MEAPVALPGRTNDLVVRLARNLGRSQMSFISDIPTVRQLGSLARVMPEHVRYQEGVIYAPFTVLGNALIVFDGYNFSPVHRYTPKAATSVYTHPANGGSIDMLGQELEHPDTVIAFGEVRRFLVMNRQPREVRFYHDPNEDHARIQRERMC